MGRGSISCLALPTELTEHEACLVEGRCHQWTDRSPARSPSREATLRTGVRVRHEGRLEREA